MRGCKAAQLAFPHHLRCECVVPGLALLAVGLLHSNGSREVEDSLDLLVEGTVGEAIVVWTLGNKVCSSGEQTVLGEVDVQIKVRVVALCGESAAPLYADT